jgi:hypothetical protein
MSKNSNNQKLLNFPRKKFRKRFQKLAHEIHTKKKRKPNPDQNKKTQDQKV